ncbi:MAG: hypothetical protein KIT84_22800 [Labilithrix sp.]|nr:hypothetical protein [Labilithrix sp.]MCW5813875.1 hypothetical protein [Labilithrix sp.]
MRNTVAALACGLFVTVVACGEVDPYGDLGDVNGASTAKDDDDSAASCSSEIKGVDPESLTACKGTKSGSKGRCVPKATLANFADTFESADCKGEAACVPEELVKSGSKIELKKCTGVLNSEGRCFWPLAKDVIANYDMLKGATKDQCEGDQVCAPCAHPVTKAETGLCKLGGGGNCDSGGTGGSSSNGTPDPIGKCPQEEEILPAESFKQEDCTSNMLCVDASLVGEQAGKLAKCKAGVCAPKKSVLRGGGYVPKTCKSTGGFEGRCSNVGIPEIGAQKALLPKADCDADELCAPCFDPRTGKETGACSQASCDKPKDPPKTFAQCCGGTGRCVPTEAAGENASSLGKDTCSGETPVCAPNEFVGLAQPRSCKAGFGLIKGICLSRCSVTTGGAFAGLIKGDCDDGELCAPCSKVPPGTAGCN